MDSVIEVVNSTSDETYYTIGVWPTLEAALREFEDLSDPRSVGDSAEYNDEYCRIEFRERRFGFCDRGKTLHTIEWTSTFNEKQDEYIWTRKV